MEPLRKSNRPRKPSARLQLATEPEVSVNGHEHGAGNGAVVSDATRHKSRTDERRRSGPSNGKARTTKAGKARELQEETAYTHSRSRSAKSRPTTAATASSSTSRLKSVKRSTASRSPTKPSLDPQQDEPFGTANNGNPDTGMLGEEQRYGANMHGMELDPWSDWRGSSVGREEGLEEGNAIAGPSRGSASYASMSGYQEERRRPSPVPTATSYAPGGCGERYFAENPYHSYRTESRHDHNPYESRSTYVPYQYSRYEPTRSYDYNDHAIRPAPEPEPDATYPYWGGSHQQQQRLKSYMSYAGSAPTHVSYMEEERQRQYHRASTLYGSTHLTATAHLPPHLAPQHYYTSNHDALHSEPWEAAYTGRPARPPPSAMPAYRAPVSSVAPWLTSDRTSVYDEQSRTMPLESTPLRFWRDHAVSSRDIEHRVVQEPIRRTSGRLSIEDLVAPTVAPEPLHFSHSRTPSPSRYYDPGVAYGHRTRYPVEHPERERYTPSPPAQSPITKVDDQLSASNEALSMLLAACEQSDYTAMLDSLESRAPLSPAAPADEREPHKLDPPVDTSFWAEPDEANQPSPPKRSRLSRRKEPMTDSSRKAQVPAGSRTSKRLSGDGSKEPTEALTVNAQGIADEPAPSRFQHTISEKQLVTDSENAPGPNGLDPVTEHQAVIATSVRTAEAIIDPTEVDAQFATSPITAAEAFAAQQADEAGHTPRNVQVAHPAPGEDGGAADAGSDDTRGGDEAHTDISHSTAAVGQHAPSTIEIAAGTAEMDSLAASEMPVKMPPAESPLAFTSPDKTLETLAAQNIATEAAASVQKNVKPSSPQATETRSAATRPRRSLKIKPSISEPKATASARSTRQSARLSGIDSVTPIANIVAETTAKDPTTPATAASTDEAAAAIALLVRTEDVLPMASSAEESEKTGERTVAPGRPDQPVGSSEVALAADVEERTEMPVIPAEPVGAIDVVRVPTPALIRSPQPTVALPMPDVSQPDAPVGNDTRVEAIATVRDMTEPPLAAPPADMPRPRPWRKQAVKPRSPRPVRATRARPSASAQLESTFKDSASLLQERGRRSSSMSSMLTSISDTKSPSPVPPANEAENLEVMVSEARRAMDESETVAISAKELAGPLAVLYNSEPVIKLLPSTAITGTAPDKEEMRKRKRKSKEVPMSASSQRLYAMLASTSVPSDTAKPAEANVNRRPARVRRAAGGGSVGVRDVEDIIVDWLDRYGETEQAPPADLPMTFTFSHTDESVPLPLPVTDPTAVPVAPIVDVIEVPDVIPYDEAADDRWQATQEIELRRWTGVRDQGIKTHKRGRLGELPPDPSPDEQYLALHRKFEIIERKQQAREKETLQHERYKMMTKVDMLKGMSDAAWETVIVAVLSRSPPTQAQEQGWEKARKAIIRRGVEWLRDLLIQEGEEVLERYNQLLPPEPRKLKADSRDPTPLPPQLSPEKSASPEPRIRSRSIGRRAYLAESDTDTASPAPPPPRRGRPPRSDASVLQKNKRILEQDTASPLPTKKHTSGGKPRLPPVSVTPTQNTMTRTASRRSRLAVEMTVESSDEEGPPLVAPIPIRMMANGRASRHMKDNEAASAAAGEDIAKARPTPSTPAEENVLPESGRGTPRIRLIVRNARIVSTPNPAPKGRVSPGQVQTLLAGEGDDGSDPTTDPAVTAPVGASKRKRMSTRSASPQKSVLPVVDRQLSGAIESILAKESEVSHGEDDDESDRSKEALEVDAAL